MCVQVSDGGMAGVLRRAGGMRGRFDRSWKQQSNEVLIGLEREKISIRVPNMVPMRPGPR